jgi:hypothetical protein
VPKSKQSRAKALPWAMMLQAVMVVGRRFTALSQKDRARLARLLRESRGRLGNLSARERSELRRLVGKLDVNRMARELLPVLRTGRRGRRRR